MEVLIKNIMKGRVVLLIWYSLIMFVLMALEGLAQVKVVLKNGERIRAEALNNVMAKDASLELVRSNGSVTLDKTFVAYVELDSMRVTYLDDTTHCIVKTKGPRDESINCK
jgi:hypothetical protein